MSEAHTPPQSRYGNVTGFFCVKKGSSHGTGKEKSQAAVGVLATAGVLAVAVRTAKLAKNQKASENRRKAAKTTTFRQKNTK